VMSEENKEVVRTSVAVVIAGCLVILMAACVLKAAFLGGPLGETTAASLSERTAESVSTAAPRFQSTAPRIKSCGDFQIPGAVRYPPIQVEVVQGNVSCRVARRVIKHQFASSGVPSSGVPDQQTLLSQFPLVDNFNRPDEGPPPSADWVKEGTVDPRRAKVSNNQLVPDPTSSSDYGFAGYQAKSAVAPVAVGFTIASLASAWDDYLELSVDPDFPTGSVDPDFPTGRERTFFEIGFFNRPGFGIDNAWQLYRATPGGVGWIDSQDHIDPWAVGDQVALTYDGTTVAAWRMKVGTDAWIKLGKFTDTSLAGRPLYGTISMSNDNPGNALDDFRFGSISDGNIEVRPPGGDTGPWSCGSGALGVRVCQRNRRGQETIRGRFYCRDWDASTAADWRVLRCLNTFGPP
jgi:hypothetical protein